MALFRWQEDAVATRVFSWTRTSLTCQGKGQQRRRVAFSAPAFWLGDLGSARSLYQRRPGRRPPGDSLARIHVSVRPVPLRCPTPSHAVPHLRVSAVRRFRSTASAWKPRSSGSGGSTGSAGACPPAAPPTPSRTSAATPTSSPPGAASARSAPRWMPSSPRAPPSTGGPWRADAPAPPTLGTNVYFFTERFSGLFLRQENPEFVTRMLKTTTFITSCLGCRTVAIAKDTFPGPVLHLCSLWVKGNPLIQSPSRTTELGTVFYFNSDGTRKITFRSSPLGPSTRISRGCFLPHRLPF